MQYKRLLITGGADEAAFGRALAAAWGAQPQEVAPAAIAAGGDGRTAVAVLGTLPKNDVLAAVAAAASGQMDCYVAAHLLPDLAPVATTTAVAGRDLILFPGAPPSPVTLAAKWLADKALAFVFILLLCPVWLPAFVAIKLDSRGPIVFRQKRLTRDKKEYNIYKFRTMFADVPRYQTSPGHGDDIRVTRVGRWLRKTGLDETAQLINVLKGQMSLVGPRPEMAVVAAAYEPWQERRFAVRPGITGLWQIAGRADLPIHEGLEFDLYYIPHISAALDGRILAKTIPILFGKEPRP